LEVPLGTSSFTSSFIKNAMLKDVRHVDLLFTMGDVQVTFKILTYVSCNDHQIFYDAHLPPPFS
jgi:hypothetical protein